MGLLSEIDTFIPLSNLQNRFLSACKDFLTWIALPHMLIVFKYSSVEGTAVFVERDSWLVEYHFIISSFPGNAQDVRIAWLVEISTSKKFRYCGGGLGRLQEPTCIFYNNNQSVDAIQVHRISILMFEQLFNMPKLVPSQVPQDDPQFTKHILVSLLQQHIQQKNFQRVSKT